MNERFAAVSTVMVSRIGLYVVAFPSRDVISVSRGGGSTAQRLDLFAWCVRLSRLLSVFERT